MRIYKLFDNFFEKVFLKAQFNITMYKLQKSKAKHLFENDCINDIIQQIRFFDDRFHLSNT